MACWAARPSDLVFVRAGAAWEGREEGFARNRKVPHTFEPKMTFWAMLELGHSGIPSPGTAADDADDGGGGGGGGED